MWDSLFTHMPAINAGLNAVAALLLVAGWVQIRRRRVAAHRAMMLSAFVVSSLFLIGYVSHKLWKGGVHTPFHGRGALAGAYYSLLISHVLLAMAVPVLAATLVVLGLSRRDRLHRGIARWAWPLWMYVSLSGVAIYLMLYHFNAVP